MEDVQTSVHLVSSCGCCIATALLMIAASVGATLAGLRSPESNRVWLILPRGDK